MTALFSRIALFFTALVGATLAQGQPAPAPRAVAPPQTINRIDDISATERSVVRVVTVAMVNGEVVGFGHGSGFAVTPTRIVTNAHVVGEAAEYPENVIIGVVPSEGTKSYPGRLIRIDRARDLAIVELTNGRLPVASIYTGAVAQRQTVYALGYPGNVDLATARNMDDFIRPRSPIASDGIVSSFDRIQNIDAIVHDADIARGSSGGPLVDACGRVVGVNTFISRADEGDSAFSFAVSVRELTSFLRSTNQSFVGVTVNCMTAAEADARDAARNAEAMRTADAAERARQATAAQDSQTLEQLRREAQTKRENVIAVAMVLFGLAILAGAAFFLYQAQNRTRERTIALSVAILCAVGALVTFLLRPDPGKVTLPAPTNGQAATSNGSATTAAAGTTHYGTLTCAVDTTRGRITVSTLDDTPLAINDQGCVNGRTQYVRGPGESWSRTLVPQSDSTVTRISYDAVTGQMVTRRYLLPLELMETVRRQRGAVETPRCTGNAADLAQLSRRENAIQQLLPTNPNEEIVRNCAPSAGNTAAAEGAE